MRLVNGDKLAEILEQWRDALNALLNSLPPNEPLTLDELREMDGEPVFLVSYDYPQHTGWRIVRLDPMIDAPTLWDNEGGYFDSRHEYGKTWLVYRRPPEDRNGR